MLQTHDTLGRQSRIKIQSTGKRVELTEARYRVLQALHDHGPLNSRVLHTFVGGNLTRFLSTLKDMSREENTVHKGVYLTRPFAQNHTFNPRANFLVFDLAEAGIEALKERGTYSDNRPRNRNPWRHSCMSAHITASIELHCIKRGYRYIPQHELLDEKKAHLDHIVGYEWTKNVPREGKLIPDALFAIDYGGKFRAFALEADRSTEPLEPTIDQGKSFKKNVLQYKTFIAGGQYKKAYGMSGGLVVLHVPVSESRARAFLRILNDLVPGCTYQCVQAAPEFAMHFKPPEAIDRFGAQAWERAGAAPFDIMSA